MYKLVFISIIGSFLIMGCSKKINSPSFPTTTAPPTTIQTTTQKTEQIIVPPTQKKETTLKKIKQEKGLVYYDRRVIISGNWALYSKDEPFLSGSLCFVADDKTSYLIPRGPQMYSDGISEDNRAPWFCFSNKEARAMLGIPSDADCTEGTATLEISNYIVTLWQTEAADSAKLERIISNKTTSTGSCEWLVR